MWGAAGLVLGAMVLAGCDRGSGGELQALPPAERPGPEARAGVPEIAGVWRFAGWEMASAEIFAERSATAEPGDLVIEVQRVDSLGALLVRGDIRIPLVGEVRRDGIVAFATHGDTAVVGVRRFAAGRVGGDTLWLELSTLPTGELSPQSERWAFVRGAVGQRWVRLPSGELLRDTVMAPPPGTDTIPRPRPAPAEAAEPGEPRVIAPPEQEPQATPPTPAPRPTEPPAEPAPEPPPGD
jgi:hypothetical protein